MPGGTSLAIDPSTPAYAAASNAPWVTGSFTPPVGSLLVVVATGDWFGGTPTLTPTSTSLSFTSRVTSGSLNHGVIQIWTSEVGAFGGSARTLSVATNLASDVGGVKCWVLTGQHTTGYFDTVGSGNAGTADNVNPTAIASTGFNGCMVFGGAVNWIGGTLLSTSSDPYEQFADADLSVITNRKLQEVPIAGSAVTLNYDAAGTAVSDWQWAAVSIRPASYTDPPGMEGGSDALSAIRADAPFGGLYG